MSLDHVTSESPTANRDVGQAGSVIGGTRICWIFEGAWPAMFVVKHVDNYREVVPKQGVNGIPGLNRTG